MDEQQEASLAYSDKLVLNTRKIEFERGELLKKLISLNPTAIEPVVAYMRTEFALHRDALPDMRQPFETSESIEEQETTKIFYVLDRLDELHYRLYHGLLNNELFDELSLNEVDLMVNLLIAEYSHVYSADYSQLDNAVDYIPELFWNHDLQEEIKDFLCNPSEPLSDKLSHMLMSGTVVHKVSIDGDVFNVVNVKSFSELIALEIRNIIARPSDFRKCVKCEVCGRLFYPRQGRKKSQGTVICDLCECDDEFEKSSKTTYKSLKTYLNRYGIPGESIYQKYHAKVDELLKKYRPINDLGRFKDELTAYNDSIREDTKGLRIHDKTLRTKPLCKVCRMCKGFQNLNLFFCREKSFAHAHIQGIH